MFFRVLLTRWSDFTDRFPENDINTEKNIFQTPGWTVVQRPDLAEAKTN
jgi:hypothetical protein